MIRIEPYHAGKFQEWNDFVLRAKNGLFLFLRQYMEYHAHRFNDQSLLIYKNNMLVALLPAAQSAHRAISSHPGLTFGGLLYGRMMKLSELEDVIIEVISYCKDRGYARIEFKALPDLYTEFGTHEMKYLFFKHNAELVTIAPSLALEIPCVNKFQERRTRQINKAKKNQIDVKLDNNFSHFWQDILIPNLRQRYSASPVHSLEEIVYLSKLFPNQIKQVNAYHEGTIVAGVTAYIYQKIIKLQYIAANEVGKQIGALDLIVHAIGTSQFLKGSYLDLGTSIEPETGLINQGLWQWKEGFGASVLNYEKYQLILQ